VNRDSVVLIVDLAGTVLEGILRSSRGWTCSHPIRKTESSEKRHDRAARTVAVPAVVIVVQAQ